MRSGELVGEASAATLAAGADAILFNCSQPEAMCEAVAAASAVIDASEWSDASLSVYANAFVPDPPSDEPYAGISKLCDDLDPEHYPKWIERWLAGGADFVGDCCGFGPEHIAEIARFYVGRAAPQAKLAGRSLRDQRSRRGCCAC